MDTPVLVLLGVIIVCIVLYRIVDRSSGKKIPTPPVEVNWLLPDDDDFFGRDNETLVKQSLAEFVERVARVIEKKTGCQTAPDRDLIRVYKNNKLVGIVRCCEMGRNTSPAIVREIVELAEHLKLKTMYLATKGPVPTDTATFARLQKVKLISV